MTQYHTGHEINVWYKNEKYQQPDQLKLNAYADFFHQTVKQIFMP